LVVHWDYWIKVRTGIPFGDLLPIFRKDKNLIASIPVFSFNIEAIWEIVVSAEMTKRTPWNNILVNRYLSERQANVWLLDHEFKNTKHTHGWECLFGHKFKDKFEAIKKRVDDETGDRSACRSCGSKVNREEQIRFCFSQLFGRPFPKENPEWLKQDNGAPLHFDGYNRELMLAFEHDGEQHFTRIEYFHPTLEEFHAAQKRDEIKNRLCAENNVNLIRIRFDVPLANVPAAIMEKLSNSLSAKLVSKEVNWSLFPSFIGSTKLSKLEKHAERHQGVLLSEEIGSDGRITFFCPRHNHTWHPKADIVLQRGHWCDQCGHERRALASKKTWADDDLTRLGNLFEPKLNYEKWAGVDNHGRYLWSCQGDGCDFPFPKDPVDLKKKLDTKQSPCPSCNKKRKRRLWEAHRFAEQKGGVCLTFSDYSNKKDLIKFKCHNQEHKEFFLTGAQTFDSEMWCPDCPDRKRQKLSQSHVKQLAIEKGFHLLTPYKNNSEKLELECIICGKPNFDFNYRSLERLDAANNCYHCCDI